jgi:hypothetical protein
MLVSAHGASMAAVADLCAEEISLLSETDVLLVWDGRVGRWRERCEEGYWSRRANAGRGYMVGSRGCPVCDLPDVASRAIYG